MSEEKTILASIGETPLTNKISEDINHHDIEVFNTSLRDIPCETREKFKILKKKRVIKRSMNQFIVDVFVDEINRLYDE